MDILSVTVRNIFYVLTHHPIYAVIGSIVLFGILLRFYCRLTVGIYEGKQRMDGKTVLITGASDGIGKATAFDLARRNARVLLACRDLKKANRVAEEIKSSTGNTNVVVYQLDLSSFDSVRRCADEVLKNEDKLHVLINNAGMSGFPPKLTADGCEIVMQTNHFGHFLLTLKLLDLLKKCAPSRIINVSSAAHLFSRLDLDDLTNRKGTAPAIFYGNTKLMNILFTRELSEILDGTGVTVNALHPGCVRTQIFRNKFNVTTYITKFSFFLFGKTSEEGAQTTIRLAVDPALEKVSGKYFADCKEARTSRTARDRALAKRAFKISEQIVDFSISKSKNE